jgi:hypothetical protein
MMQTIPGLPDDVVAVVAQGTVTGHDYESVLIPAVERGLATHEKLRLLYHLGPEFTGFTAAALWDDTKIGIRHLTAFAKVAVVTDVRWVVDAAKVFGLFIPCPVRVFGNDRLAEAKTWVST